MSPSANEEQLQQLRTIWDAQKSPSGRKVDLARPAFPVAWAKDAPAMEASELAKRLKQLLGWPKWVRLYAKPALAVVAASRLAKDAVGNHGVVWMAPGTGSHFEPPAAPAGLAVLRGDWAPEARAMRLAAAEAQDRGLLLCLDDSITGFRLAPGGAAQHFGLTVSLALYGPALAAGLDFAALAGVGPEPPESKKLPDARALSAAGGVLAQLNDSIPEMLHQQGKELILGLEYFTRKAQVSQELDWEGPLAMPRLSGRRAWAFMELAKEEGLTLGPLVMTDPTLGSSGMSELVWPRLARAAARLRVLPEGEMAPLGWRDAAQSHACARVADILAEME